MKARAAKRRRAAVAATTAFWDTSGIVPLCCFQPQSARAARTARLYGRQVVWWATAVEVVGSFNRLYREEHLTREGQQQALQRFAYLRRRWNEVQPTDEVRDLAERLLGVHTLRSADALQLAAALVWSSQHPRGRHFIGADGALSTAAQAEGFTVINLIG